LSVLGAAYARAARVRRAWYASHPQAVRSLARPVVSVGNLSVGGSGKTPVVAALARLLLAWGERPAVLTRGYARRRTADGVVVAGDGAGPRAPVALTGDEPQMLARMLPGVPILVSPDRYLAGRLAERRFGCTVMLLDDGFQHLTLGRETDLVLVTGADLDDRVLPDGRLREAPGALATADAVLVPGAADDRTRVRALVDPVPVFAVTTRHAPLRAIDEGGAPPGAGGRVVAVAGIARPERFFTALGEQGVDVAHTIALPDHHRFGARDLARVARAVEEHGAGLVVTTEKDAVRLPAGTGWAVLPMEAAIEPEDAFATWLRDRI
jgi:tetraacyldisaccharide 4'-kinase